MSQFRTSTPSLSLSVVCHTCVVALQELDRSVSDVLAVDLTQSLGEIGGVSKAHKAVAFTLFRARITDNLRNCMLVEKRLHQCHHMSCCCSSSKRALLLRTAKRRRLGIPWLFGKMGTC
jgi:hypothetical protein